MLAALPNGKCSYCLARGGGKVIPARGFVDAPMRKQRRNGVTFWCPDLLRVASRIDGKPKPISNLADLACAATETPAHLCLE